MTVLLLEGGHEVAVKTPAEEVAKRLSDAGWTTTYQEHSDGPSGEKLPYYSYREPRWAEFEPPRGRNPVRVRTDVVLAILP